MTEQPRALGVHPFLARRVADHITQRVLHVPRHNQVYPGVFAHPDGEHSLLVVMGAAPISEPAIKALRSCKYVDQYLIRQFPDRAPVIDGPRRLLGEEAWADAVINNLALTRDVNCVMSIFEVMVATQPLALANLATASGMIAAHIPFELEEVDNRPFQNSLSRELDRTVDEIEAAS